MRRAGSGRLPDGRRLTWTVADGSRGRRWRSTTVDADGRLLLALLVEVALDGSITKVEAASPSGLLTLHPEGRTLHGNVVRDGTIEHVTQPLHDVVVLVPSSPLAAAVVVASLARRVPVGEGTDVMGVEVGDDLRIGGMGWRVERMGDREWRFAEREPGGTSFTLAIDADGIPVLDDPTTAPLERSEHDAH